MVRTEEGRWRGKKRPDGEDRRGLIVRTEEDRRGLMARTEEDRWREPKRTEEDRRGPKRTEEDRWRGPKRTDGVTTHKKKNINRK
jgi:hypothetical protein